MTLDVQCACKVRQGVEGAAGFPLSCISVYFWWAESRPCCGTREGTGRCCSRLDEAPPSSRCCPPPAPARCRPAQALTSPRLTSPRLRSSVALLEPPPTAPGVAPAPGRPPHSRSRSAPGRLKAPRRHRGQRQVLPGGPGSGTHTHTHTHALARAPLAIAPPAPSPGSVPRRSSPGGEEEEEERQAAHSPEPSLPRTGPQSRKAPANRQTDRWTDGGSGRVGSGRSTALRLPRHPRYAPRRRAASGMVTGWDGTGGERRGEERRGARTDTARAAPHRL